MATTKTTKTNRSSAAAKAKAKAAKAAKTRTTRSKASSKPTQKRSTKAQASVRANVKFGPQRTNVRRKVVSMRDKRQLSWAEIGSELDVAPRTARRLYDEQKGSGAHHGLLPGKGGRQVAS